MQLHALNLHKQLTAAVQAQRGQDYECLECHKRVRLRGGTHRQNHFYHLEPNRHCRLAGKSMAHLQTQYYIHNQLPLEEAALEYRFPQIKRIADVVWLPHKIVFEIQCSFISAEEIMQRNADYRSIGWQTVWILHDERFGKKKISVAEGLLHGSSHYFTNMNDVGIGVVYDRFNIIQGGMRKHSLNQLPIQIPKIKKLKHADSLTSLQLTNRRLKQWAISFKGDLIDLTLHASDDPYVQSAMRLEELYSAAETSAKHINGWETVKDYTERWICRPYRLFLQILLERACR